MNLPKLATTAEGTVAGVRRLPWPWPTKHATSMYSAQLDNGRIDVDCDQHGRITAQLTSESDEVLLTVTSCPLVLSEPSAIALFVFWNTAKLEIIVNDELVGSNKSPIPNEYHVEMNRTGEHYDFSAENESAIKARHDRLAGHGGTPLKGGRQRSNKDAVFDALRDEIVQIDGLIQLIGNGGFQHAIGLSGITRKMIATGVPLPLVQLSAAFIGAPLTIYTHAARRRVLPSELPTPSTHLVFGARPTPELLYENPVDLDIWLETPAGQVGGEYFTHRQLIKKIGDTLGAHFDLDVHPSVPALRGLRSGTASGNVDFLIQYVCQAAELARHLGLEILTRSSDEPK